MRAIPTSAATRRIRCGLRRAPRSLRSEVRKPLRSRVLLQFTPRAPRALFLARADDLRALRAAEPGMHAVVFTAYTNTHAAVVRALRDDGLVTIEFSGSTGPVKRDEAIREFQRGLDAASASVAGGGAPPNHGLRLRRARRQRWHHADGGIARLSDGTGARSGRRDAGRRTDPSVSRVRACDARAGF